MTWVASRECPPRAKEVVVDADVFDAERFAKQLGHALLERPFRLLPVGRR